MSSFGNMSSKKISNAGRICLRFKEEERPFGNPLEQKRGHRKISTRDIAQIANDFYMVSQVGAIQIELID
jgi:hypothetical protein